MKVSLPLNPLIENCPACGGLLSRALQTVKPISNNEYNAAGELLSSELFWQCMACNCTWKHGQSFDGIRDHKHSHNDDVRLAQAIADDLFMDADGNKYDRMDYNVEIPERGLGRNIGWTRSAMRDRILNHLRGNI